MTRRVEGRAGARQRGRSRRAVEVEDQRRVVAVLTEGHVTERQYLRAMAGRSAVLDLRESGLVPVSLVERARVHVNRNRKRKRDDRFDEIWCVFDRDDHLGVKRAIKEAGDLDIGVAFSNP